ncbi:F0F1 ATP synthase subunit delta [filamentous cyanobacterium CCP5]|nr:F0F1 ATP synthase subunit delta [filamentous cyanobacterium CCP5]
MKDTTATAEIAGPYAQALMAIAKDRNLTEQIGDQASGLLSLIKESDALNQFLASPLASPDVKKGVLKQIMGDQGDPVLMNFLMLLVDRNRVMYLGEVLEQYRALLRQLNQTVLAEVTSATELSDDQQSAIRDKVKGLTNARQVELSIEVDPSLLGGLIIQVESKVIDASLRGQLRRIGMQLSAAA